jgi:hypothetical protein
LKCKKNILDDLKCKKRRIELVFLGPKLGYNNYPYFLQWFIICY